jgi:hypothetical protein
LIDQNQYQKLINICLRNISLAKKKLYLLKKRFNRWIKSSIYERKNSVIRSSSIEYLTFIAATGDGGVNAVYQDENIWLSQKMMGELYHVEPHTINYHLKKIFSDSELEEDAVTRNFRITAQDGKSYNTKHYNLSVIIAVGYKVNSERAVQFRKWATQILQEFTIKGFAMDDERLKNDGTILGKKYFLCEFISKSIS